MRGMCHLFVPHTTAAITINENTDPNVRKDMIRELLKTIPMQDDYLHAEGNAAAHILSTLVGRVAKRARRERQARPRDVASHLSL